MSNVINLRAARKSRSRTAARKKADANAAKHGQSKSTKTQQAAQDKKLNDHLDGHKREPET